MRAMAWIHLPAPWPCRLRSRRRSREIPKGSIREATFSCGSGNRSPDYGHSEIDPATRKAVSLRIADHLFTKWWPTRPSEYALFSRLDGQSLQAQCDAFLHSAIECVPEDDINPEGCGSVHDQQDREEALWRFRRFAVPLRDCRSKPSAAELRRLASGSQPAIGMDAGRPQ